MKSNLMNGLIAYKNEANYVSKQEISPDAERRIARMRARNQKRGQSVLKAMSW